MNVVAILDAMAAQQPEAIALAWRSRGQDRTLSFGDFATGAKRIAGLMRGQGLARGDAVVVFLPMGASLYQVTAAALRLGLVPVFADPADWRSSVERAVAGLHVRAFVGTTAACILRWFVPVLRGIPLAFVDGPALPRTTSLRAAARCPPLEATADCADDTLALLGFTSGSSGPAKGVLRTHGVLRASHAALVEHLSLQRGEAQLATLPLFVLANLGAGVTSVIPPIAPRRPAEVDPAVVVRQMQQWQVSSLVGTPALLRRVAAHAAAQGLGLRSVRRVFVGGAPVLPGTADALVAAMPEAEVSAVYGATEAEPIAVALVSAWSPELRRAIAGGAGLPAGQPVAGVRVAVIEDRWGRPREACTAAVFDAQRRPPGAAGEVVVSGPNVSPAYLDAPDDRQHKLVVDGVAWQRTGDAGYLDAAGALWLVGRCAHALRRDGRALYPLQVEAALAMLPRVAGGTLVDLRGRRVLVVQAPGLEAADLVSIGEQLAWCGADEVAQVVQLPLDRRHRAKIRHAELVEALERGQWLRRVPLPRRAG